MRCEAAGPELVAYLRGELDEPVGSEIERHLTDCGACRQDAESFASIGELLEDARLGAHPPRGLKDSTFARLQTEDLGILLNDGATTPPSRDLKSKAMARALAEPGSSGGRGRPGRRASWLAAAAAVVGIAVAAGSQMQVQDLDRELASVQASVRHVEESFGPVGHPMQAVQLAGNSAEADAELIHFRHDNYRMTVRINDIEVTPPDHHYEMWVAGERGEVSVGSFRIKRPDDLTLNFAMGVDPGEFPEVLITLEKSDGDPRMSSELVARAELDRDAIYHGTYEK